MNAQHNFELYNSGALIHVEAGAEVHVLGDVHMNGATGTLENNGLIKTQGNTYSDDQFQQRGTGIYRIENDAVNTGERQKIEGSFAVRSTGSTQMGVDDGSFYDLELANDQGIVFLVNTYPGPVGDYVADVRNDVDFWSGTVYNRIITHDIGISGAYVPPADGPNYSAVFGIMNPTASLTNNTVAMNGNMSATDAGYVQGALRRVIDPAGGSYSFVLGLEPAGAGAQRGMQYARIDFTANTYDVIVGHFDRALPNNFASATECSGYWIDYWGGNDHGQWIFNNPASGAGTYTMNVWPQDDNFPVKTVWMISKDNAIDGTANQCGASPIGLSRGGFNGFSAFGLAAADVTPLPIELMDLNAQGIVDHIAVTWNVASESNFSHYELERSEDGLAFEHLVDINGVGNTLNEQSYSYDDYEVRYSQPYYYRLKNVDLDGAFDYSPVVSGSISKSINSFEDVSLALYPNPTTSEFVVSLYSGNDRDIEIKIYNSIGKSIENKSLIVSEGNTLLKVVSESWAPGVYYIELTDVVTSESIKKKIIKQ